MSLLQRCLLVCMLTTGVFPSSLLAQYQAINFDTSCYWVSRYDFEFSFPGVPGASCKGYICSVVDKDTLIGGQQFWKLRTYVSNDELGSMAACLPMNDFVFPQFVREDTVNRRVDLWMQGWTSAVTFRNYNLQAGDTLREYPNFYHIIDSVTYANFGGVTRRLQWYRVAANLTPVYTIEGVGSLHSWPWAYYYGADYPAYTLTCFMRGTTKVYPPWTPDTCGKGAPVGISSVQNANPSVWLSGRTLKLNHVSAGDRIDIFSLNGQSLYRETLRAPQQQFELPVQWPTGVYILTLHGKTESLVQRLLLRE